MDELDPGMDQPVQPVPEDRMGMAAADLHDVDRLFA